MRLDLRKGNTCWAKSSLRFQQNSQRTLNIKKSLLLQNSVRYEFLKVNLKKYFFLTIPLLISPIDSSEFHVSLINFRNIFGKDNSVMELPEDIVHFLL